MCACCPTIRSRSGIDCWHGFSTATTVVSAHDRVGLGASPSTDRRRISADREAASEEAAAWEAHSVHRCRASTLGRKAKAVGRKALMKLDTVVCPDRLLRWHRQFGAQKWNFSRRRGPGWPGIMREISELIMRMAQDNPRWGYTRIQGALANLSHKVGRGTIANVLKRNGIEPSPGRSQRTPWSTFLKAHCKVLAACDFLTVEVWTGRGLVTHYLLFVISLTDRAVKIVGITTRPDESWMLQIARNVTDSQAGALHSKRYLIIDRDTKYSEQFRRLIRDAGTNVICLPQRSPNLNAYAERFVRSIKDECLNRMIFIGQASLRRAVAE